VLPTFFRQHFLKVVPTFFRNIFRKCRCRGSLPPVVIYFDRASDSDG
jgi:hypothetical protein